VSFIRGPAPLINQPPLEINDDRQPSTTVPAVTLSRAAPKQAAHLSAETIARQLRALGAEVVRVARQFQAEGTCDYADDRQFARHNHAVQPEASNPAS
jgi:hypothetical protein